MASNPIVLIFLPTVYILGACVSILQFQVVLALLARGVASAKKIDALQPVLPRELPRKLSWQHATPHPRLHRLHPDAPCMHAVILAPSDYLTKVFG